MPGIEMDEPNAMMGPTEAVRTQHSTVGPRGMVTGVGPEPPQRSTSGSIPPSSSAATSTPTKTSTSVEATRPHKQAVGTTVVSGSLEAALRDQESSAGHSEFFPDSSQCTDLGSGPSATPTGWSDQQRLTLAKTKTRSPAGTDNEVLVVGREMFSHNYLRGGGDLLDTEGGRATARKGASDSMQMVGQAKHDPTNPVGNNGIASRNGAEGGLKKGTAYIVRNLRANPEEKRSENHRKSVQNSFAAKLLTS